VVKPALLAVDWGTSSLRGALLAADGAVIVERTFPRGILTVPPNGFAEVFNACFADWRAANPGLLCLMAGMVGSRQGWQEAAYCACPAGFADIAGELSWIAPEPGSGPGRIAIVPGLCCAREGLPGDAALATLPDVMRGEETQVFGTLQSLQLQQHKIVLVLPGTHSKWVQVASGRITSFTTFMTGECYALLRQHSILARTLPTDEARFDEARFVQGVQLALRGTSLLQTAFSVRTLALFERLSPEALKSYLSGLVIGEELRAQSLDASQRVVLIANAALTHRYQLALAQCGIACDSPGAQVTWAGLSAIAQTLANATPLANANATPLIIPA
jgi:2-dehydro-3-deoxygalactonokinase